MFEASAEMEMEMEMETRYRHYNDENNLIICDVHADDDNNISLIKQYYIDRSLIIISNINNEGVVIVLKSSNTIVFSRHI